MIAILASAIMPLIPSGSVGVTSYSVLTNTGATLALAAPPCGTVGTQKGDMCIRWTVVPCPPAWHAPPPDPEHLRVEDFPPILPVGCPR